MPLPKATNLKVGDTLNGWRVMQVLDASNGNYVFESSADSDLSAALATAIADWSATRTYAKGNICLRNKAFFDSKVDGNIGKDPGTDTSGAWGPFVPGETSSVFFNRAPTNADVYPVGAKWYDVSFGADTPLTMLSLGNGAWGYLNAITLAKIRINLHGIGSTYRSELNSLQFFKPDGTQIPNGWFVWGAKSGVWGAGPGVAFASQAIGCGYNTWGWADIEVSSSFDSSITIGKLTGQTPYAALSSFEFWYTNGSKKVFSPGGAPDICTCDPAVICRYGDSISAAQGEMLTATKLSNADSNDYGRISGAAFVSAFNTLFAAAIKPYADRIKALEPPAPLSVVIEKGFPSAEQSTATLSPPDGKTFKSGGLYTMLNRIAPDNASISQGTGGTHTWNYATPTEPGTYMLIMQPEYTDGTRGDIRETFTIT